MQIPNSRLHGHRSPEVLLHTALRRLQSTKGLVSRVYLCPESLKVPFGTESILVRRQFPELAIIRTAIYHAHFSLMLIMEHLVRIFE